MVVGIFLKFIPKTPAMNERGRKIVEIMVNTFITSFNRRFVELR
jgi:hypothetical protein